MTRARYLASSSLCLSLLCAATAAHAQGAPDPAPVYPELSALPSPVSETPSKRSSRWYGWQILIPGVAADAMLLGGAFETNISPRAGSGIMTAGLVMHGISGPIVHLAHGRPGRALGSFTLEAALPALFFALATATPCKDADGFCAGHFVAGAFAAASWTAGLAIDASALAWEDAAPRRTALTPSFSVTSVAPLVLSPLRIGSAHTTPSPTPTGVALMGTF